MKKDYIILSQRLAGVLMQNGFVLRELKPSNKENVKRNVFIFNDSQELRIFIEHYKNQITEKVEL